MSQLVLDDQLSELEFDDRLKPWTTFRYLRQARPGEIIKDERVPTILRELGEPTFVTIDGGFWNRALRDVRYCILWFDLPLRQQRRIPDLLRRLFRLPEFRARRARMGKVARVAPLGVDYWQLGDEELRRLAWPPER